MLKIKQFAKNVTVSEVSSLNFSKNNEIASFLKEICKSIDNLVFSLYASIKSIEFDKFNFNEAETAAGMMRISRNKEDIKDLLEETIPTTTIKGLEKSFSVLYELQEKDEILEAIEHQLHSIYGNSTRNTLVKEAKAHREKLQEQLKKVTSLFTKEANKRLPSKFKTLGDSLLEEIKSKIHSKVAERSYLTPQRDSDNRLNFYFTRFFKIKDFTDDEGELTYPEYFVVLTCVVEPSHELSYYLNTLHKFRIPGTFNPGTKFTDYKSLVRVLNTYLEVDKFSGLLNTVSVPIEQKDLSIDKMPLSKKFIKSIKELDQQTLRVQLNSNVKISTEELIKLLMLDMKALLSKTAKFDIKYKIKDSGANTYIDFSFLLPQHESTRNTVSMTPDQHEMLKNTFNFDDKQIKLLNRVITKGF